VGHALRAFGEVEDALANDYYLRKREGALAGAVSSSADSIKFGREQLEQGQIDMFTVLRLTGENLAAKVQYTQIRASRLRERVNLYLALGGDFAGTGAPK
jgi:outer membrane protein TolC